jgi:preprotein translocase subunit SecF
MLRILHGTSFDFIRHWRLAAILTGLFIVPAVFLLMFGGLRYSIEFTGGTVVQVRFTDSTNVAAVRAAMTAANVPGAEPVSFGTPRDFVIRAQELDAVTQQESGAETVADQIRAGLTTAFGAGSYQVIRTEAIGPRVGEELSRQAVIAVLISFALTLVYLAWRFEWRFSVATILATVHDIIATVAFMRYMGLEVSLFVVGAVLTVVGYSMNDTVVVFDRVRENLHSSKKESLYAVLNRSVNETLPRTVMTSCTTLACLFALLVFGGAVIRPFAWVLAFGIFVGTFSSIYVASPVLLWIENKWPRADIMARVGRQGVAARPDAPASAPTSRARKPAGTAS